MQRHEIGFVSFALVAGLGCGPTSFPAQAGTESSTQGDGDGDGDGAGDGDGDGDGDSGCEAQLAAEIEPLYVELGDE